MAEPTRTVGIDLASQPDKTGFAVVAWNDGGAVVEDIGVGADDDELIERSASADAIGIDVPFGWPQAFVELQRGGAPPPRWDDESRDRQRFRATDRAVRAKSKRWPLSVSSDLIAVPAMRAQRLLVRLDVDDRSGLGRVVETYPALALQLWGLRSRGYKSGKEGRDVREELWGALLRRTPWLAMDSSQEDVAIRSDDALDALVAALVARASRQGLVEPIPDDCIDAARTEGWIAIPTGDSLERLADA